MKTVPVLSPNGWITTPEEGMSEIMAMYFANKRSQSDLFNIHSIAYDLAKSPDDTTSLSIQIQNSLLSLYNAYFPEGANVTVTTKLENVEKRHYRVQVQVECVDGGKPYNLATSYGNYTGGFARILEGQ